MLNAAEHYGATVAPSQLPRPVFRPCPGSPLSDLVARGACASLLRRRVPTRSRPPPFTRLGASDPIVRSLPLRGDPLGMSGEASPPRTGSLQAHPDPPRTCPPPRDSLPGRPAAGAPQPAEGAEERRAEQARPQNCSPHPTASPAPGSQVGSLQKPCRGAARP